LAVAFRERNSGACALWQGAKETVIVRLELLEMVKARITEIEHSLIVDLDHLEALIGFFRTVCGEMDWRRRWRLPYPKGLLSSGRDIVRYIGAV
jgi:hypothetical protein